MSESISELSEVSSRSTATGSTDRSVSRGREFHSSGRGGAGNIRKPADSQGPAEPAPDKQDVWDIPRGRELNPSPDRALSTGRGGVGNIRSRSRARAISKVPEGLPQTASIIEERIATTAEYERNVMQNAAKARAQSSGRGGAGNIFKSRSSSRGPDKSTLPVSPVHSTGRGGAGNLYAGNSSASDAAELEEFDRQQYTHEEGIHSTGRGGVANLTAVRNPPVEPLSYVTHDIESTGRGGVGNFFRSRSASRNPDSSRSPSRTKDHGFMHTLHKATHPHHKSPEADTSIDAAPQAQHE